MTAFLRGRYAARLASGPEDVEAAQRLRFRTFIEGRGAAVDGPRAQGLDADDLDSLCDHMLIEERRTGRLICCFRMMPLANGAEIARTYSARYYDLSSLQEYPDSMVEMGRFCIDPAFRDPDVIRVAWSAMMRYVDERSVGMVFGCSSFKGVDADAYMDAFALLKERHLAPKRWLPRVKAPKVFRYATRLRLRRPNMTEALKRMPPLLRSYLMLGGWVSDHAVIDHDLNTLHVFTGIEMRSVPPRRLQLLRQA